MAKKYTKNIFSPKNILIYLIVGGLLYAVFYFIWKDNKANQLTVPLSAQNASGEMGSAVLTDMKGKTKVTIVLTGAPTGIPQPAHIHMGACPNPGAIKYPLSNVVDGKSETTLDIPLTQLKAELPLAVNVHKSTSEAKVYVACGNLGGTPASTPASTPGY